jgi:protein TonB
MMGILAAALMQSSSADPALRYYPEEARRKAVQGIATVDCTVTPEGKLTNCTVLSEDPVGWGFGDAALRLTPLFKMHPALKDGVAVSAEIHIPIRFKLPK